MAPPTAPVAAPAAAPPLCAKAAAGARARRPAANRAVFISSLLEHLGTHRQCSGWLIVPRREKNNVLSPHLDIRDRVGMLSFGGDNRSEVRSGLSLTVD